MIDEQTKNSVEVRWPARPYSPGMRAIILYVAYLFFMQVLYLDARVAFLQDAREVHLDWIVGLMKNISIMSHFLVLWGLVMGRAYSRHLLVIWLSIQCVVASYGILLPDSGYIVKQIQYYSIPPLTKVEFGGIDLSGGFLFVLSVNMVALIAVWRVLYPDFMKKQGTGQLKESKLHE